MGASAKIALQGGSVSYSTTGLVAQMSSHGQLRLIQEVGYAMLKGNVRTLLTGDSVATNRMAQIEMGCLNKGFMLGQEFESEELPLSCSTTGNKTIYKSSKWTGSIETMQIDPVLMGIWTGMTIKNVSSSIPIRLIVSETLTSSAASVVTLTDIPIDLIEVKRVSDNGLHYEDDAASDSSGTFILNTGAKTLTFENIAVNQSASFVVTYRYASTTTTDGLVIEGSLANFPSTFGGWLSFLAVAQDDNAVGRVIAQFDTATITSRFELGGQGVREQLSKTLEFTLQDAPIFYWEEFSV